jgi:hypothetical protein
MTKATWTVAGIVECVYTHGRSRTGERPERQVCKARDSAGDVVTLTYSRSDDVDWAQLLTAGPDNVMVLVAYPGKYHRTAQISGQDYVIPPRGRYLPLSLLRPLLGIAQTAQGERKPRKAGKAADAGKADATPEVAPTVVLETA